jgi:hypothetical protein
MATRPEPTARRRRLVLHVATRRDVEVELPVSLELASALQIELATVFVTEDAIIRACQLPFPTVVGFAGGPLTVDPVQFEAAIRREERWCRQLLAAAADRARLPWSFESLRGEAFRLLREASADEDILVLKVDRLGLPPRALIAAARELAPARGGVILVPEGAVTHRGLLVTIDRSPATDAPLAGFAASLANALGTRVAHAALTDEPLGAAASALDGARLLLARLESELLDDPVTVGRVMSRYRRPLLLIRGE